MKRTRGRLRTAPLAVLVSLLALVFRLPPQVESGMPPAKESATLTQAQASAFARLALKGIKQEYPNKPGTS